MGKETWSPEEMKAEDDERRKAAEGHPRRRLFGLLG
jgi:hypothetical protein